MKVTKISQDKNSVMELPFSKLSQMNKIKKLDGKILKKIKGGSIIIVDMDVY